MSAMLTLAPVLPLPISRITHVHVESESRDCDGRHSGETVSVPNPGETGRDLFTWWVRHIVQWQAPYASTIERGVDDDGNPFLEHREDTEEGWHHAVYTGCADERCRLDRYVRRDHTAEAAGY